MQVHHIDPKGQDSGVVYSEMQGRENTSGDLMALRFVNCDLKQKEGNLIYFLMFRQVAKITRSSW